MKIKVVETKLGKEKIWGQAHFDSNTIEMDSRLKGKKHLEILIHEAWHLLNPKAGEPEVVKKSIILTNLLWDLGYRRVDDSNSTPLQDGKTY